MNNQLPPLTQGEIEALAKDPGELPLGHDLLEMRKIIKDMKETVKECKDTVSCMLASKDALKNKPGNLDV